MKKRKQCQNKDCGALFPQAGQSIQIPARKVVKFKAGTKLIDAANQ